MVTDGRSLSAEERHVLVALALGAGETDQPGILGDIDRALVRPINGDGSILEFIYEDYERPDQGQMSVGYEGLMLDLDDVQIELILYWDRNRRLCEFELLRISEGELISPQWNSFHLKKTD
jgi:hypothetical protein